MLDLSVFQREYWEVKLFDGSIIHISKPSQRLVIDMMAVQQTFADLNTNPDKYTVEDILKEFNDILMKILNNNKEEKKFTIKYIEQNFDLEIGNVFISEYMEFVNQIQNRKNS